MPPELEPGFVVGRYLSLEKSSFFVSGTKRPFLRLDAKFNKSRKPRDQFIRSDLAERLEQWLKGKPDAGRLWRLAPHADLALLFRRDLEAARAAWIAAAEDADERQRREKLNTLKYVFNDGARNVYADFHGLRHTGITLVVRKSGIRVGQEWAGHSTPVLTARYADVNDADLVAALEGLPAMDPSRTKNPAKPPRAGRRRQRKRTAH